MKLFTTLICLFIFDAALADIRMNEIKKVVGIIQENEIQPTYNATNKRKPEIYAACFVKNEKNVSYGVLFPSNSQVCYTAETNGTLKDNNRYHRIFYTKLDLQNHYRLNFDKLRYDDGYWDLVDNSMCYFSYSHGDFTACINFSNSQRFNEDDILFKESNTTLNPTTESNNGETSIGSAIAGICFGLAIVFIPVFLCVMRSFFTRRSYERMR